MASWAPALEDAKAPAPRPLRHVRRRERRLTGGVLWIAIVAVLLAGVVATNVAVLRLNMGLDRLGRQRADLRARNAELQSQLSTAASAARIQGLAARRLGWVPATGDQTTYFNLPR